MQLFVKKLDGKTLTIKTDYDATILQFKQQIYEQHNISVEQQQIIICGKKCNNDYTLKDYKAVEQAIIHLIIK
jgi:hypothetical protein